MGMPAHLPQSLASIKGPALPAKTWRQAAGYALTPPTEDYDHMISTIASCIVILFTALLDRVCNGFPLESHEVYFRI